MTLFIKNMVCPRCIMVVKQLLDEGKLKVKSVLLGQVELYKKPDKEQLEHLSRALSEVGFELLTEPHQRLVDKIKTLIIQKVQQGYIERHFSLSSYLKSNTLKDYSALTKVFSETEGCTIEKYFILQKIEKAKELLLYQEVSIGEIATRLGYSSCQHLSMQFKKVTKYSPKEFKAIGAKARHPIDDVITKDRKLFV